MFDVMCDVIPRSLCSQLSGTFTTPKGKSSTFSETGPTILLRNSQFYALFVVPQIFIFRIIIHIRSFTASDRRHIFQRYCMHRLLRETVRVSEFGQWLRLLS
jgi:hypothetical protein